MKAKVLSFVFISFSESGLFNGLHPIQIQKIFSFSRLNTSRGGLQEFGLGRPSPFFARKRNWLIWRWLLVGILTPCLSACHWEPRRSDHSEGIA